MLITYTPDQATDQLGITAHKFVSGDGPARLITSGTLPSGLAAGTDYWLIRQNADNLKLATTRAGAITGIADATFSTNGSGTQQIDISLPFRSPRTYASLVQVFSADLNALIQSVTDAQIASRPITVAPVIGGGSTDWSQTPPVSGAVRSTAAAPAAWIIPLSVGYGDVITKIDIRCKHSVATAVAMQFIVFRNGDAGSSGMGIPTIDSAASTAAQTLTTGTLEMPIDDDFQWTLQTGTLAGGAMTRDIFWVRYYVRHRPFMVFP